MAKTGRVDTPLSESQNFGAIFNRGGGPATRDIDPLDREFFEFFLRNRLNKVIEKQERQKGKPRRKRRKK